ncbi:hypothetical protein Pelo_2783 [Pelomyxa schiedti]|nr:hypothetical protein Pelo_2783 [Pelomyxa schiedti]
MASNNSNIILQCIDPPYRCAVADLINTVEANPTYVNVPNVYGWTPLRCAVSLWCEADALHLATALLRCGANARMASTKGLLNPVHEAARKGRLELIKAFAAHDPTLMETEAGGGLRALHYAVESKNLALVQYLVEVLHVNVESGSAVGLRPLHYAVESKKMEILQYLVEHANVDVQALTTDNNSCLHYAGAVGWKEAFTYLENRGVQANTFNSNGWTAYGKLCAPLVRKHLEQLKTFVGPTLSKLSALTIMTLVPVGTEEAFLAEMKALPPGSSSTAVWRHFLFNQVWHAYKHGIHL